ncbi:MAG: hypothetical protein EBV42_03160, partial [Actinobacteria bacterium]|nr:hypothetical protein [Actinomycetota bacterium]
MHAVRLRTECRYHQDEQHDVAHNVANTQASYDSGICRLSPMYTDTQDFLFQTRKPSVERNSAQR